MDIKALKNIFQDCHINFLIGSGFSAPFLPTVGQTEQFLTELSNDKGLDSSTNELIRASILGDFFESVIYKNLKLYSNNSDRELSAVLAEYKRFLQLLHSILWNRRTSLLSKQVNIFTTNIDLFLERAFEDTQYECNDGFSGRFKPTFSLTNFRKSFIKRSSHYDNSSEIPSFNLFKLHGSLTWQSMNGNIHFSDCSNIEAVNKLWLPLKPSCIAVDHSVSFSTLKNQVKNSVWNHNYSQFLDTYSLLSIVNPSKEKFQQTTLNLIYYELLRIFSNELEKENVVLFIVGFSISDEHIREIILRAANSNPTLLVLVYGFDDNACTNIESNLRVGNSPNRNNNVRIIRPPSDSQCTFKFFNNEVIGKVLKESEIA